MLSCIGSSAMNQSPRIALDLEVSDMVDDGVAQALKFKGCQ